MKDNLLNIGSIVEVENSSGDVEAYMIIGKRVINHETIKAWDYISVPFDGGYKRKIVFKKENVDREENYFYFNHYEIEKVIYKCDYSIDSKGV